MFKNIRTKEQLDAERQNRNNVAKIDELRKMLSETDYKVMPDYDKPNDEIKRQRALWREEIRSLESKNKQLFKILNRNSVYEP